MNCYACNTDVDKLLERIAELERKLFELEATALHCIDFVGAANYTDRIIEAKQILRKQAQTLKEQE